MWYTSSLIYFYHDLISDEPNSSHELELYRTDLQPYLYDGSCINIGEVVDLLLECLQILFCFGCANNFLLTF